MKKVMLTAVCAALMVSLCACSGSGSAVPVQRADQLAIAGQAGDRYAGMVVNEAVVEINRDSSKKVDELYVKVGQAVKTGDKLFSYDLDEVALAVEKAQLEVEKMKNEQVSYTDQLAKLEKQLKRTYNEYDKTKLSLEINTLKTTMMENEYNLKLKDKEISNLQEMLQNIDILAPVDGTVRKIDDQGQGSYITIQQAGAYRIQGAMNEMNLSGGLMIGSRVNIYSRISEESWTGTVVSIDTESASQNGNDRYYMGGGIMDTMSTSSNYVFYVELDSVEGLLLGQHVYMEAAAGQQQTMPGLWLPENFLMDFRMDEETYEITGTVWAENGNGRLEKRNVTLGMYDDMTGCYEVVSGITEQDYLADPSNPNCASGASVSRREPQDFTGGMIATVPAGDDGEELDGEEILDIEVPVDSDGAEDGIGEELDISDVPLATEEVGEG